MDIVVEMDFVTDANLILSNELNNTFTERRTQRLIDWLLGTTTVTWVAGFLRKIQLGILFSCFCLFLGFYTPPVPPKIGLLASFSRILGHDGACELELRCKLDS